MRLWCTLSLWLLTLCPAFGQPSATYLWYDKPATKWEEALPVGNGRLGAMIYGTVQEENIQLNEATYWSGGPYSTVVKGGHTKLKEIQSLVFNGEMLKAHNLFGRYLMGYPVEQQKYQSLANLILSFKFTSAPAHYKRWLDLETATSGVDFEVNGVMHHREIFSTAADQVIVIRLSASQPGQISFTANLRGVRNQAHSNYGTDYFRMDPYGTDGLKLSGKSADYLGVPGQLRYEATLKVIPDGGTMQMDGYLLNVSGADAVTIRISAATNFVNYQDVSADAHERADRYREQAASKSYDELKRRHVNDYQNYFKRVSIRLQHAESALPTNQRVAAGNTKDDPQLAALAYNFGRYVLISSSRPDSQPANLQGIWNNDMNPAWDSKYTTNINTEMNYWIAEPGNLSELSQPLLNMVNDLVDQGSQVAREHYGCKGWVFHQNTDLWRVAAPMDGPTWGTFTVGGAWLLNELYKQYSFNKDPVFIRQIYPALKGSVLFFSDFLISHPNGKWLVTNPSTSPENFPGSPGNGRYFDEVTGSYIPGTTICAGSSIDMQVLTDLFANFIEAAGVMKVDEDLAKQIAEKKLRLVPPQVGKDGSLQEWADDWSQLEKNHRHFSHLYGLYPGNVFSMQRTPLFLEPIRNVLRQRGDGGTGWSRAWKVALWARLHDGEQAQKILDGYFREQCYPQFFAKCNTPLQVDGTLGMSAAISEMLIQSHEGYIEFLPALPAAWSEGEFNGVCVRDGFVVDMKWSGGKMQQAVVVSKAGQACRVKTPPGTQWLVTSQKGRVATEKNADVVSWRTAPGQTYMLSLKR